MDKALGLPNAELVAIVENSEAGMARASEAHPQQKIVQSIDDVMDEIDAAIVVTPTSYHYELVKKLLENGKHVFCEKPLTDRLEDANELEKLVQDDKLVVQVGHSERFHPVWKTLKDNSELNAFFDDKACITIDRYAPFKGRATDVDVVSDLMIHDLDLLWYLFGEHPIEVSATGHKIQTDKWDHATAVLKFASGRRAILTCGRSHVEEQRRVQIIGNKGTLLVNLMDLSYSYAWPGATEGEIVRHTYERADHLLEEQKCFYDSIINKKKSVVSMSEGIQAVYWIASIQKSLNEEIPVKL